MSASKGKSSYIAQRRVIEAFGPGADGSGVAIVLGAEDLALKRRLRVRGLEGDEFEVGVVDPVAVASALARDDLSRVREHALVLVNRRFRLIAIAIGPATPPNRLEVLANVVRLGPNGAVEIPGADGQPSWLLFETEDGATE